MNILFAASEIHPLIKTGGLADVAGYLPLALQRLGVTVNITVPGYTEVLDKLADYKLLQRYDVDGFNIDLIEACLPETDCKLLVPCCPQLYERDGGPYQDNDGNDWPDNAIRFGIFAKIVVEITRNWSELKRPFDLVHCNDWQTGLIPALLKLQNKAPATLFTIHNLAYQGLFPYPDFAQLHLSPHLWAHHALEFYDKLSFIKGGLVFADHINTVSPGYAAEIQTEPFGCGLDGLLHHRAESLSGILNGVDTEQWNPETDNKLVQTYSADTLLKKSVNKRALRDLFGLPRTRNTPLFSMVTRLTQQKGIDLLLDAFPLLGKHKVQFAILGAGDRSLEQQLNAYSRQHPEQLAVKIAYNEDWAHLAIAGADAFLMPSRFEPCGLTQLYSMRYGTVPVVHAVGGLGDTVIDANPVNLKAQSATGIQFKNATGKALAEAIIRTSTLFADKPVWNAIQQTGMQQDFSWQNAAKEYIALYEQILRTGKKRTDQPGL